MYVYGTQYSMIMCPEAFVSITMAMVYLPVFYKLQITSSYEVTIEIYCVIIETLKRWILSDMTYLQYVVCFIINSVNPYKVNQPLGCGIGLYNTALNEM